MIHCHGSLIIIFDNSESISHTPIINYDSQAAEWWSIVNDDHDDNDESQSTTILKLLRMRITKIVDDTVWLFTIKVAINDVDWLIMIHNNWSIRTVAGQLFGYRSLPINAHGRASQQLDEFGRCSPEVQAFDSKLRKTNIAMEHHHF